MKVIIFNGYGFVPVSDKIAEFMNKSSFPLNRTDKKLIKYIEENSKKVNMSTPSFSIVKELKQSKEKLIKVDKDQYYCYSNIKEVPCAIRIVEVDISRPWTIEDYDGAEYIQYLDYIIENKEINYCKYKN